MKIVDRNLTGATGPTQAQESQRTGSAGNSRAGSARSTADGDRVEFSGALGRLSKTLSADSAGRAARVQSLATQYQSGNYRPDPATTSRKMVAEALAAH